MAFIGGLSYTYAGATNDTTPGREIGIRCPGTWSGTAKLDGAGGYFSIPILSAVDWSTTLMSETMLSQDYHLLRNKNLGSLRASTCTPVQ